MEKRISLAVIVSLVAVGIATAALVMPFVKGNSRIGYVLTAKVMSEFEMKKQYETRLQQVGVERKKYLDDLKAKIDHYHIDKQLTLNQPLSLDSLNALYESKVQEFSESNEQMVTQYNDQVFEKFNSLMKAYGREKGYDLLLGADGSGTLMYAPEDMDVTADFIVYANDTFKGTITK